MSAGLQGEAAFQTGLAGFLSRQILYGVPQVPDDISLGGKTVLVTGSNTGLGFECAHHYLKLGAARLIMAVRSTEKGETAAKVLRDELASDSKQRVEVWKLDMESFQSVQDFASLCTKELGPGGLHVAMLNAGLSKAKYSTVTPGSDGEPRETTVQVNYLATALLAILLLPALKRKSASEQPGRLTISSSDLSYGAVLPEGAGTTEGVLESLNKSEGYSGFTQYTRTKLLLDMFVERLANIVSPEDVIINATNPGPTKGTDFGREYPGTKYLFAVFFLFVGRGVVDASRIYVHSSLVLGKESHGSFVDWVIRPWPSMMYTDAGRQIGDRAWEETMDVLRLAGVKEILNEVGAA